MNLIQRAMDKVFGKGKSKAAAQRRAKRERSFPVGTRFTTAPDVSRQIIRSKLREELYNDPTQIGAKGMKRKERRNLARAYASKQWKEIQATREA